MAASEFEDLERWDTPLQLLLRSCPRDADGYPSDPLAFVASICCDRRWDATAAWNNARGELPEEIALMVVTAPEGVNILSACLARGFVREGSCTAYPQGNTEHKPVMADAFRWRRVKPGGVVRELLSPSFWKQLYKRVKL